MNEVKRLLAAMAIVVALAGLSATRLSAQCGGNPGCDSTQWYWAVHSGIQLPCGGTDCFIDIWFSYRVVTCPGQPPQYQMRLDSIRFNSSNPPSCAYYCADNMTQVMAIAVDGLLRYGPYAINLHTPWLNWPPTGPGPCITETKVSTAVCWKRFYFMSNGQLDYMKMTGCAPDVCCTKTFKVCWETPTTCSYTYIGTAYDPNPGPSACNDFNIMECVYTCDYVPLMAHGKRAVEEAPGGGVAPRVEQGNDRISIDGTTPDESQVDAVLFDISGGQVATASAAVSAGGAYHIGIDTRHLASGTYFYVLRSARHDLTSGRISVTR